MADPVFDAVLRRERDDAYLAIAELVRLLKDEFDDDPLKDPAGYVVSTQSKAAVTAAMGSSRRPQPVDRDVATLDDLVAQLLTEGLDLERAALDMVGTDFQNAHQGRALGLRQAGLRLADHIARCDQTPVRAAS